MLVVKELERLGIFSFFSFEQLDAHRSDYQDWTEASFVMDFQVPETLYQDFVAYLKTAGIPLDTKDHKSAVLLELKAALAYQLFGDNAVLKIKTGQDPMVQKALALKNKTGQVNNIHLLSEPKQGPSQTTNSAQKNPKEITENRES